MKYRIFFLLCMFLFLCGCKAKVDSVSVYFSKPIETDSSDKTQVSISADISNNVESSVNDMSSFLEENSVLYEWKSHPQDFSLIAFTFDDAPNSSDIEYTVLSEFITTLNSYGGAGTVFVNGHRIEKYGTDPLKKAIECGFELGNHTYHHTTFTDSMSVNAITKEITELNELVKARFNYDIKWFRPAELAVPERLKIISRALCMPMIGSSGDIDWKKDATPDSIYKDCIANAVDGNIILLHCWSNETKLAFPKICSELYNRNFRFVTLSELFEYKDINFSEIPTDKLIKKVSDCK